MSLLVNISSGGDALQHLERAGLLTAKACDALAKRSAANSIGPQLHEVMRELALTLASTERILAELVCETLSHDGIDVKGMENSPITDLLAVMRSALPANRSGPIRRLPPGGTVSLLYSLGECLEVVLRELGSNASSWSLATSILAKACKEMAAVGTAQTGLLPAVKSVAGHAKELALRGPWADLHSCLHAALIRFILGRPVFEPLHARLARANAELLVMIRMWILSTYLHKDALSKHERHKRRHHGHGHGYGQGQGQLEQQGQGQEQGYGYGDEADPSMPGPRHVLSRPLLLMSAPSAGDLSHIPMPRDMPMGQLGAIHTLPVLPEMTRAQGAVQGLISPGRVPGTGLAMLEGPDRLSQGLAEPTRAEEGRPFLDSSATGAIPYARRVLQALSMPRSSLLWPLRSARNALLVRVLDTYYAAFSWSYALVGLTGLHGWVGQALRAAVFLVAFMLYALFPGRAADRASSLMARPDVSMVAHAWRGTDTREIGRLLHLLRMPRLATRAEVTIAGVKCHVLSNVRIDVQQMVESSQQPLPPPEQWPGDADGRAFTLPRQHGAGAAGAGVHLDPRRGSVSSQPFYSARPASRSRGSTAADVSDPALDMAEQQQQQYGAEMDRGQDASGLQAHGQAPGQHGGLGLAGQTLDVDMAAAALGLDTGVSGGSNEATGSSSTDADIDLGLSMDGAGGGTGTPPGRATRRRGSPQPRHDPGHGRIPSTGSHASSQPDQAQPSLPPTFLYVHGGGFIACSAAHDLHTLASWVAAADPTDCPLVVVYPEYSLSPEHRFPVALQELMRVYSYVRSRTPAVMLHGESAGGHLSASLLVWAASLDLPMPRTTSLLYPALNIGMQPSPSRALHMNDSLISYPLLIALASAYMPPGVPLQERIGHPLLAPLHAPEELLAKFPPTYILAGGLDPLLDDAVDFHTRLRTAGVDVTMDVLRPAPHGFFAFPFLTGAQEGIQAVRNHVLRAACWQHTQ